jgi:predicted CxxxxCH...CXXCH cytochrome family protein
VTFYNYTGNHSTGSTYRFGCSNCHPTLSATYHRNSAINIDLSSTPTDVGNLKKLNTLITAPGTSYVKIGTEQEFYCDNVYCHSNGNLGGGANFTYKRTPNWYATFTGNRCGMCHDNPPQYAGQSHYNPDSNLGKNGTSAKSETGHMIGIHAFNTYVGNKMNGFLGFSSVGQKAHGRKAVANTITCTTCHYGIVSTVATEVDTYAMYSTTSSFNCSKCHKVNSPITKLQTGKITDTSKHVNGKKDIRFDQDAVTGAAFKTKAQLNNQGNALGWQRNGFKTTGSTDSYDYANITFATYSASTKTCFVACHVNQPNITWGKSNMQCVSCHAKQ